MDILDRFLGSDVPTWARFLIAFAVVFALVLLLVWLLKRVGRGFSTGEKRGRAPRLAVLEAVAVDQRRRLVLVRRDNMEHLLLIGGPSDLVVEQSIVRPQRPQGARPAEPNLDGAARPAAGANQAPTPVARPEPRLAPSPVPEPADEAGAARPAPRMAVGADESQNDGTQRQLAEMAERLEMALRAPGAGRPGPSQPASETSRAASGELRTSAQDRIARSAGAAKDGDRMSAAAQAPEKAKSGSLFGRLTKRSSE